MLGYSPSWYSSHTLRAPLFTQNQSREIISIALRCAVGQYLIFCFLGTGKSGTRYSCTRITTSKATTDLRSCCSARRWADPRLLRSGSQRSELSSEKFPARRGVTLCGVCEIKGQRSERRRRAALVRVLLTSCTHAHWACTHWALVWAQTDERVIVIFYAG